MDIRGKTNAIIDVLVQTAAMVFFLSALAGCAAVFKVQTLYEAPQPDASDKRLVVRLEKEQNPITGPGDEYPARSYKISPSEVKKMMAGMYRRFFKDPETFVPPGKDGGLVGAVVDAAVDSLLGEPKKRKERKSNPGAYRPELSEDWHPAAMSKRVPIFTPKEIDMLAPQIAGALAELRTGEHLTLKTRAFHSGENSGAGWQKNEDETSVAIRFEPSGTFLGISHGARISWYFYVVQGLHFRSQGGAVYSYWTSEKGVREEYDFLVVFPQKEGNREYWQVDFPVD